MWTPARPLGGRRPEPLSPSRTREEAGPASAPQAASERDLRERRFLRQALTARVNTRSCRGDAPGRWGKGRTRCQNVAGPLAQTWGGPAPGWLLASSRGLGKGLGHSEQEQGPCL